MRQVLLYRSYVPVLPIVQPTASNISVASVFEWDVVSYFVDCQAEYCSFSNSYAVCCQRCCGKMSNTVSVTVRIVHCTRILSLIGKKLSLD